MTRTRYAGMATPARVGPPVSELSEDGFEPGDLVGHVDYPDFRARFVEYNDGKAKVLVLDGWRGPSVPKQPVPMPRRKLVGLG